ncbi:hypothetical protein MHZ90_05325 [Pantoea sp. ACRSH]|uniref:hypothetical protein n=1 Tax=unclassified Pantoea TaxID=2630326 RepID=UPI001EF5D4A7|nr:MULTISPECIES: hypothetical protein [unclassified Pantoea]MCG7365568.1 hypothetical protein [Pantoea sp. ACRSH]MCG7396215.1 hypothetical protein [Pantoea sp. ACRSC]
MKSFFRAGIGVQALPFFTPKQSAFFINAIGEKYFPFPGCKALGQRSSFWRLFQQLNAFVKKGFDMAGEGR